LSFVVCMALSSDSPGAAAARIGTKTSGPYLCVAVHLLLIGIPYRFGLLPTGWLGGGGSQQRFVPGGLLGKPCMVFYSDDDSELRQCTAVEGACER